MRSRAPIFAVLFVLGLFALPHFAQASVPFFGPIIPNGGNEGVCPAGFGMLIQVINNIISFSITIAIVFVAPIMTAYSGFLMVVNQGNAENLSKAKGYLINTVIGIVVALCGWMLVDAIMAALYASPSGWSSTWSELISGDASRCLDQAGTQPGTGLNQVTQAQQGGGAGVGVTAGTGTGKLTFQSGISAQVPSESGPLSGLISCLGGAITSNAQISSISDSLIVNGSKTWANCRAGLCQHAANSCHYGGRSCGDASYAVDVVGNNTDIVNAADVCGAATLDEGNHVHVSIGGQYGCGCDTGLD